LLSPTTLADFHLRERELYTMMMMMMMMMAMMFASSSLSLVIQYFVSSQCQRWVRGMRIAPKAFASVDVGQRLGYCC